MKSDQIPNRLFPFMVHFLKPYKRYVVAMFLVSFLYGVHSASLPYILKLLVDRVNTQWSSPQEIYNALLWPAIGYVALSLFLGVVFRFYNYIHLRLIPDLKRDVHLSTFKYLQGHSHTYFQNQFAGSLSNKVMDLTRGSAELIPLFMNTCVDPIFSVSIALFAMGQIHSIFAIIFGVFVVIFMGMSWIVAKKCQPLSRVFSEARSTSSGKIVDSISNMMTIRLFSSYRFENAYIKQFTDDVVRKDRAVHRYLLWARLALVLTITVMLACMVTALIWANAHSLITAGDLILILTLTHRVLDMLWQITNQFVQLFLEVGTCKQALGIIAEPPSLVDSPRALPLQTPISRIVFDSVSFGYGTTPVFSDLNLQIEGGSKVGLVGFSGSGKTTFINLILRFFDLESGKILIDGQDISKVTQDSLRESISMIPQDTTLFHRTLMDNIRYGRLEATDEEVITASKLAPCEVFIGRIPEGYHALVGERGIKLSGGQRQRIAIARAMLKNAPILILDEATSALDSVTESLIQDSLRHLIEGRTTIVIAHRLSTLSQMDRLLVFDGGKIVQDGSHEELLKAPGQYQQLWNLQAHGFLPE